MIEDALKRAGGDITLAADLLAADVVMLTGEVEVLGRDMQVCENSVAALKEYNEIVEPSFLEKLTGSTIFKVGLFIVGVEVGRRMVLVK